MPSPSSQTGIRTVVSWVPEVGGLALQLRFPGSGSGRRQGRGRSRLLSPRRRRRLGSRLQEVRTGWRRPGISSSVREVAGFVVRATREKARQPLVLDKGRKSSRSPAPSFFEPGPELRTTQNDLTPGWRGVWGALPAPRRHGPEIPLRAPWVQVQT